MIDKLMQSVVPYVGLLRLYSLADLILMLYAAGAKGSQMAGAVLMWISFLAFLEAKHSHPYRPRVAKWWALVPGIPGFILFDRWPEAMVYILASYIYSCKNEARVGPYSCIMRGVQYAFLVHGVSGNENLTFIAFVLTTMRNFVGDWRDVEKDLAEGLRTLPIDLGITKSCPAEYHLIGVAITTTFWWVLTTLNPLWLLGIFVIEYKTYYLTPRGHKRIPVYKDPILAG